MRSLVVNADDLGLTEGVNDGIFDAHEHGILTSASLFANAPATVDAVQRAKSRRSLGIGVHLALVDGIPVLPPSRVPSLVDSDGRLLPSWKPFIAACLMGRVSLDEVERELIAQIGYVLDLGLRPTHLDAHKHVHAYPPVFAVVARLAARFGIPVVRAPYESWTPQSTSSPSGTHARRTAWRQAALNAAMWPWTQMNRRVAASLGLRTPRFVGRIHTGILDAPSLRALLRATAPGVTELMVHPGYLDEALRRSGTRLLESRERELELLIRLETRALIAGERIDLVRHDLMHTVRRSLRHVS